MFVVETPRHEDLNAIVRLAWRNAPRLYPAPFFEYIYENDARHFRIVRETASGRVVGFVIASRQPGTERDLFLFTVNPAYIGKGLRRRLLREIQNIIREDGQRVFIIEVPANDRATIQFFAQKGFPLSGLAPLTDSAGDAVLLAKQLT